MLNAHLNYEVSSEAIGEGTTIVDTIPLAR